MLHTSPPYDAAFWSGADLKPKEDILIVTREVERSDMHNTTMQFVNATAENPPSFYDAVEWHPYRRMVNIYETLKSIQRQHRGHGTLVQLQVPDEAIFSSGGALFLAAVHIHLDAKTIDVEPIDTPPLQYCMTAAGLHAMSWLWTLLDVQNTKAPSATVQDLHNSIMWFSEMITGSADMVAPRPPVVVPIGGKHAAITPIWGDKDHQWVDEKRRHEEEQQRQEEERRRKEEVFKKQEEVLHRLHLERKRMEEEVENLEEAADGERQRAERERQAAALERQRAEMERQRAEMQRQQAEMERIRNLKAEAELEEENKALEEENKIQQEIRRRAEQELKAQQETVQGMLNVAGKKGYWELDSTDHRVKFENAFHNEFRNNWNASKNYPAIHRAMMMCRDHFIGQ